MPNTAKQEAIRKAYGEYWEQVKDKVDSYGRLTIQQCWDLWNGDSAESHFYSVILQDKVLDLHDDYQGYYQPKSLQGIENNRGWIRIESEDWLKEHRINSSTTKFYINDPDEDYFDIAIQLNDKEESIVGLSDYLFMKDILIKSNIKATHYQPIVKPEKPIY